jgi:hypothetical protein
MSTSGAVEINMLGNVFQQWSSIKRKFPGHSVNVDLDLLHHEFFETASKSFLTLGTELRRLPRYPSSETDPKAAPTDAEVIGDVVAEISRDGRTLRSWSLLDILDPYRIAFDSLSGFWNREYPEVAAGTSRLVARECSH